MLSYSHEGGVAIKPKPKSRCRHEKHEEDTSFSESEVRDIASVLILEPQESAQSLSTQESHTCRGLLEAVS